jgi:hypothetical protein
MLGYVAAVFAAFGFVFVKDTLRDTILTPAELEGIVAYPVLATVPHGLGVPLLPGSDAQVTLDSKGLFSNTYTGGRL